MKFEPLAPRKPDASLAGMAAMFKRGSALVDAALAALNVLNERIAKLDAGDARLHTIIAGLAQIVEGAAVGVENLLIAPRGRDARPLTLFTLARQGTGAVSVQSIEIDRAAVALSDGGSPASTFAYDHLRVAARGGVPTANVALMLDGLRSRAQFATSRLSISKARLDLQASFLDSVTQADVNGSVVRLESHLNVQSARDMALDTRRLLSRASLNIANGNRQTLQDVVARHLPNDVVNKQKS